MLQHHLGILRGPLVGKGVVEFMLLKVVNEVLNCRLSNHLRLSLQGFNFLHLGHYSLPLCFLLIRGFQRQWCSLAYSNHLIKVAIWHSISRNSFFSCSAMTLAFSILFSTSNLFFRPLQPWPSHHLLCPHTGRSSPTFGQVDVLCPQVLYQALELNDFTQDSGNTCVVNSHQVFHSVRDVSIQYLLWTTTTNAFQEARPQATYS